MSRPLPYRRDISNTYMYKRVVGIGNQKIQCEKKKKKKKRKKKKKKKK